MSTFSDERYLSDTSQLLRYDRDISNYFITDG